MKKRTERSEILNFTKTRRPSLASSISRAGRKRQSARGYTEREYKILTRRREFAPNARYSRTGHDVSNLRDRTGAPEHLPHVCGFASREVASAARDFHVKAAESPEFLSRKP